MLRSNGEKSFELYASWLRGDAEELAAYGRRQPPKHSEVDWRLLTHFSRTRCASRIGALFSVEECESSLEGECTNEQHVSVMGFSSWYAGFIRRSAISMVWAPRWPSTFRSSALVHLSSVQFVLELSRP